jgi:hypothetical protein
MDKHMRDDFRKARMGMERSEPIAPIRDHFFKASMEYQEAAGCATIASFVKSWRAVRRQRRHRRELSRTSHGPVARRHGP